MRSVKEAINVPKDSSIEEVYDRLVQFGEYAGSGVLLERIFKGIQLARTIDAKDGQQAAVAVGGGATAGAAVDQQPKLDNEITQKDNQVYNIINNSIPKSDNLGNNIISNKTDISKNELSSNSSFLTIRKLQNGKSNN